MAGRRRRGAGDGDCIHRAAVMPARKGVSVTMIPNLTMAAISAIYLGAGLYLLAALLLGWGRP